MPASFHITTQIIETDNTKIVKAQASEVRQILIKTDTPLLRVTAPPKKIIEMLKQFEQSSSTSDKTMCKISWTARLQEGMNISFQKETSYKITVEEIIDVLEEAQIEWTN